MERDIRALYNIVTNGLGHDAAIARLSTQMQRGMLPPDIKSYVFEFIRDPRKTCVFYYTGHGENIDGRLNLGSYVPEAVIARRRLTLTLKSEWSQTRVLAQIDGLTVLRSL